MALRASLNCKSLLTLHTASQPRDSTARSAIFSRRPGQNSLRSTSGTCEGKWHGERNRGVVVCGLNDFIGGDLIGLDLGQWCDDVENYGSIGFYAPPEGGAELRYATSLKYRGYHLMNVSSRGLGDVEAYLLKPHGVRPPHLGKQAVARFYYPGEVDYRLSVLAPRYKGLVVWVGEAKVLAKNELQFLALLPVLRPRVKVVVEMGSSRKFEWKPMKDLVGLPSPAPLAAADGRPLVLEKEAEKEVVFSK